MISLTEKTLILSGTIFGSIFLFSTSLNCLNKTILKSNELNDKNMVKKLIILNGVTLLCSSAIYSYLLYIAIK